MRSLCILVNKSSTTTVVDRLSRTSPAGYVRPYIAGRLLLYVFFSSSEPDTHLQLRWALLPPLG